MARTVMNGNCDLYCNGDYLGRAIYVERLRVPDRDLDVRFAGDPREMQKLWRLLHNAIDRRQVPFWPEVIQCLQEAFDRVVASYKPERSTISLMMAMAELFLARLGDVLPGRPPLPDLYGFSPMRQAMETYRKLMTQEPAAEVNLEEKPKPQDTLPPGAAVHKARTGLGDILCGARPDGGNFYWTEDDQSVTCPACRFRTAEAAAPAAKQAEPAKQESWRDRPTLL